MTRWTNVAVVAIVLGAAGCQQGKVGNRPHDVYLTSHPEGATPHIVLLDDLNAHRRERIRDGRPASDKAIMADERFLSDHRVPGGVLMGCDKEPSRARYPGFNHVLIATKPGYAPVMSQVFTPPSRVQVRLRRLEDESSADEN